MGIRRWRWGSESRSGGFTGRARRFLPLQALLRRFFLSRAFADESGRGMVAPTDTRLAFELSGYWLTE